MRRRTLLATLAATSLGAGGGLWIYRGVRDREMPATTSLDPDELEAWLATARARLDATAVASTTAPHPGDAFVVLSLARAEAPAVVAIGRGVELDDAIGRAVEGVRARVQPDEIAAGRLKLDVLENVGPPDELDENGHFRLNRGLDGIWLRSHDLFLLPEEVVAAALIDSDHDLHGPRLRAYLQDDPRLPADDGDPGAAGATYRRLRFASVAEASSTGAPVHLYRGNPSAPNMDSDALFEAARSGGAYLLRHHRDDGSFDYSYRPDEDRLAKSYNLLRHAGTCYALYELAMATGDDAYTTAADLGVRWLLGHKRAQENAEPGTEFDAIVSEDGEAKLGGAALAMIAMLRGMDARGDRADLEQVQRLARFLLFQQEADGHLVSKYFYGKPDEDEFESQYYPGEAILALVRLAAVDGDTKWLDAASRAADWLIDVRDHEKPTADLPHDHWLLMGLSELHDRLPKPSHVAHAIRIGDAILGAERTESEYPDWIGSFRDPPRSTPAATRSEGLVALTRLAAKTGRDEAPYRAALRRIIAFQLRCQFVPENVMYLRRPQQALGGFRKGLAEEEVRIDYVQHNVCAILGYRSLA